jgi:hypothetical protein
LNKFSLGFKIESSHGGHQVAGAGAVAGLQFLFDKDGLAQIEAVLLMKALYVELLPRWKERHSRVLMLHDIQFQLCQYSRKYTKTMPERRQKDELEHRAVGWVSEALNMLSGGSNPELIFAQLRTHIASLEDVR